ncbi:MAG: dipeptide ABC transporter ATP-binding protein [Oscillospiraceae bacterium]
MSDLLEVKDLKKYFKTPRGMLHAVDGVSFTLEKGKTLGVVGESGCGKSTLGRVILHLLDSTEGEIYFDGKDITNLSKSELNEARKHMQMIFQDPYSSINPRMRVCDIIGEPLKIYKVCATKEEYEAKVDDLMKTVGLAERVKNSYPHELDGGRRQRIGIARALALNPEFIVCDEPVSALDVSIQAQILNLMQDLQKERGLTYIFITHNLSVVKHISDEICVMYLGNMVEKCSSKELFKNQLHPYTKALLSAIPRAKVGEKTERILLKGEISSPINPKPGCRFAPRCLYAKDECFKTQPQLKEMGEGHFVACHYVEEINK